MAGLAVYDIAPLEDRLEELCQLVGGDGDLLNALKPRVEQGDFAGVVRELLENHQDAFKAGSDEGACWQLQGKRGACVGGRATTPPLPGAPLQPPPRTAASPARARAPPPSTCRCRGPVCAAVLVPEGH